MFVSYRGVLISSDELPLEKDENLIHALLLGNGWEYNRKRGSYRIWFPGGGLFVPGQRHAYELSLTLRRLRPELFAAEQRPEESQAPSTPEGSNDRQ
jgi:hypothetical protein